MRKAEAKVHAENLHLFRSYFLPKLCAIALIPHVLLASKFGAFHIIPKEAPVCSAGRGFVIKLVLYR